LPAERQKGLRAFWLDGLFAALSTGFADAYYTLYMLSLHASNAQIGLVNTLTQLSGAIMALPGAEIAERTGRYKRVVLFAASVSRLMWLVMLAAPWLPGDSPVWVVLFAWTAIAGMGTLGNAAWTALSADLVPERLRGGYFASRNMIMQFVSLVAIPFAGFLINIVGEPEGYQVNLGLALAIGTISLYYYSQLPEHAAAPRTAPFNVLHALRQIARMPNFLNFVVCHAILMLGVMIGAPFLNVLMAEEAGFSVGTIGLVTTVGGLSTAIGMRIMGRMHNRLGITGTMRFGLGVPLVIVAWQWVREPWHAYLINGVAGITWAGYNLGAFNLLLASTPDEHRPHYIAIYTTIISIVSAIGPTIGGWLLDITGFGPVLTLSGAVRAVGLILFFILVREPQPRSET
jgi:MFS family permease